MTPRWWRAAAAAAAAMISVTGAGTAVPAAAAASPKTVYFTFDDGPGAGTAELLDAAAAYDAKVTLFYVGVNGEQRPDLVARAAAEGHVIGNHTYGHKSLPRLRSHEVHQQLAKAQAALQPYVSNCWRPPGWATSPAIEQAGKRLGLRQTLSVMDPTDKRQVFVPAAWTDPDRIVAEVQKQVFDGAMVTLHAERAGATGQLGAFKRLLPLLTARGYRFKALPYCGKPTYRMLAVGDGIAAGGYRTELDSLLRRGAEPHGLNHRWVGSVTNGPVAGFDHDGHRGWTVDDVDRNITKLQAAYQPDVILLNAGSADIMRGATADAVTRRMTTLLQRIRRNQPSVRVFVSVPPALPAGRVAGQRQNTALQEAMPGVIRGAGSDFFTVDLRPGTSVAFQYYRAMRNNMPNSGFWPAVPGPRQHNR
ncbi:polysaccharide deacetylase family protein [Actinoplanes sp. NPDC024001]|uniref:polysaccharide deacetylase family protein n=1 Tax=Actinoplanes sp. NPDC024001 TaxID=3154598 RepID=UPI0033CB26A9